MDKRAIYQKTPKGAAEIATRNHRLAARTRSVLILVDGKRSAEQIVAQAMHLGDVELFLAQLADGGFIESTGSVQPDPANTDGGAHDPRISIPSLPGSPETSPPFLHSDGAAGISGFPAPIPVPGIDRMTAFMATKAFATRYFIDLLGPEAGALTMKIESARTEGQLLLLMEKCREIVQQLKGRDRAERFWQRVQDTLYHEP